MKIPNKKNFKKNSRKIYFFTNLIAFSTILFFVSCKQQLVPEPTLPSRGVSGSTTWGAPQNLSATQGRKGKISLSWTSVNGASQYYIYKSTTAFGSFVQAGETVGSKTSFDISCPQGTSMYYKVKAVDSDGDLSEYSYIIRGTSLAVPVISDIETTTGDEDGALSVYWWMSNVDSETYEETVRYVLYCQDPISGVITEYAVPAGNGTYMSVSGLNSSTEYNFYVEAYTLYDQKAVEKSTWVDAQTARRLKPHAPNDLKGSEGVYADKIQLSWKLPGTVDVSLGDYEFDTAPVFFKIYRRALDSGSDTSSASYEEVCSYFGMNPDLLTNPDAQSFSSQVSGVYTEGSSIVWEDTLPVSGLRYQYKVQTFVDHEKSKISATTAYAETVGWKIPAISTFRNRYERVNALAGQYEDDGVTEKVRFDSATLNFLLEWDNFGTEEGFTFKIIEYKTILANDSGTFDTNSTLEEGLTLAQVAEYKKVFDLTGEGDGVDAGRYKYKIILCENGTEVSSIFKESGVLVVTNSTDILDKEKFNVSVVQGYKNKVIVKWSNLDKNNVAYTNVQYTLSYKKKNSEDSPTVIENDVLQGCIQGNNVVYEVSSLDSGFGYDFVLSATNGIPVVCDAVAGYTLGKPVIQFNQANLDYKKITVSWQDITPTDGVTPIANYDVAYTASYCYEGLSTVNIDLTSLPEGATYVEDAEGKITLSFLPENYSNAYYNGKNIIVSVVAQTEASGSVESGDKATANVRTLGPGAISTSSEKALYAGKITYSWSVLDGVDWYVVTRTVDDDSNTSDYYLVNIDTGVIKVCDFMGDFKAEYVSASGIPFVSVVVSNGIATLTDTYVNNTYGSDYDTYPQCYYRTRQGLIGRGQRFLYSVQPLFQESDSSNIKTDITATNGIKLNNVITKQACALGYGKNVRASKGCQQATFINNSSLTSSDNTSIYLEWDAPDIGTGSNPTYFVYRRKEGGAWEANAITTSATTTSFEDTTAQSGIAYEYLVGSTRSGAGLADPRKDSDFIVAQENIMDNVRTAEKRFAGYKLKQPEMISVSRNERAVGSTYGELVKWGCAGVATTSDTEFNRGVDGYVVEVYNVDLKNSDGNNYWAIIKEFTLGSDLTADSTYKQLVSDAAKLKVLRNYRQYFRVRAFAEEDGKRSYSEAPTYTWSDGAENNYVKWGARQLTLSEFAEVAAVSIGDSLYNSTYSTVEEKSTWWVDRKITFASSGPNFQNISGNLWAYAGATGSKPSIYGRICAGKMGAISGTKDYPCTLTFTGVLDLYSGTVVVSSLNASSGSFYVTYNNNSGECYTTNIGGKFTY